MTKLETQNFDEENAPSKTHFSFAIATVPGVSSPLARTYEFVAEQPGTWPVLRAELGREIAPLSLVTCTEAQSLEDGRRRSWATPAGTITEEWDAAPAANSDDDLENDVPLTGRVRFLESELLSLTSGPHDGTSHESLVRVFFNDSASTLALFIANSDTGYYEERVEVIRTGK